MKLEVRMANRELVSSAEGFESRGECELFMQELFDFLGLTYKKPFTSCWVVADPEHRKISPFSKRPGVKPPWKPRHSFGPEAFILNDSAVCNIRVICAGDFQNVALELLKQIFSGTPLDEVKAFAHAKRFIELPEDATRKQIEEAIDWADRNKGNWPCAEARLFKPIFTGDGSWA